MTKAQQDITHVIFGVIGQRREVEVPLAEAWQFYVNARRVRQYVEVVAVVGGVSPRGGEFRTSATGYTVDDLEQGVRHLARIGLGADGSHGPHNPDPRVQRLAGYNATRAPYPYDPDLSAAPVQTLIDELCRRGVHTNGLAVECENDRYMLVRFDNDRENVAWGNIVDKLTGELCSASDLGTARELFRDKKYRV